MADDPRVPARTAAHGALDHSESRPDLNDRGVGHPRSGATSHIHRPRISDGHRTKTEDTDHD